jgi:hypothetical protein
MTTTRRLFPVLALALVVSSAVAVQPAAAASGRSVPPSPMRDEIISFDLAADGSTMVSAQRLGRWTILHARSLPDGPPRRLGRGVRAADAAWGQGHRSTYRSSLFADPESRWARITPDSRSIVTLRDTRSGRRLVSVPLSSGKATRLTPIRRLHSLFVTPDSSMVVFVGDLGLGGGTRLYSVPVEGGAVTALDEMERLPMIELSPDSARIVYRTGGPGPENLRSVPVRGGAPTTLHLNSDVHDVAITADGTAVVFVATVGPVEDLGDEYFLWRTPIGGAGATMVSPDPVGITTPLHVDAPILANDAADDIVYFNDRAGTDQGITALASDGTLTPLAESSGPAGELRVSPDGRHLVEIPWGEPRGGFAIIEIDSRRRTFNDAFEVVVGEFASDGDAMLFTDADDNGHLWLLVFGRSPRLLAESEAGHAVFTGDGSRVVFAPAGAGGDRRFLRVAAVHGNQRSRVATIAGWHISYDVADGVDVTVHLTASDTPSDRAPTTGQLFVTDIRPRCRGRVVTIAGTPGNDVLDGTSRNDVIDGGRGEDTIRGSGGADVICGRSGADRLRGGPGDDLLAGGGGPDVCVGGRGRDRLRSCR